MIFNDLINDDHANNAELDGARSRGMSGNSTVMSNLMGPLYSEEEKKNWNNMKKDFFIRFYWKIYLN